ncbi:MAG: outer membrane lipoprotein-sorting protein [Bacteriovoracaceae bacterium]|nr:outer membrane lipoprotein-sorting protein [Bacteriovoracaceae bacterium]
MPKVLICLFTCLLIFQIQAKDVLKGHDIATKAYNIEDGSDLSCKVEMEISKGGGRVVKHRTLEFFRIDDGINNRGIFRICSPKLLKGTTFLSWNNAGKDNDLWIYLPSKKKSRRVAGNNKYQKFVSSDFTYDDLSKWSLTRNIFKRLADDKGMYVIESVPKEKSEKIARKVVWVDKVNFVIMKVDYYNKSGKLVKTLTVEELKKINGIWTVLKSRMKNFKSNSETILEVKNVVYDSGLSKGMFVSNKLNKRCRVK